VSTVKLDINAAFQQVLRHCDGNGHCARERLDLWIRTNDVRLYDGDDVVDPGFFASDLRINAKLAKDGRWSATVWPSRIGLTKQPWECSWAVEESELAKMIEVESGAPPSALTVPVEQEDPRVTTIKARIAAGHRPGKTEQWERFCDKIRESHGVGKNVRGYSDRNIKLLVAGLPKPGG
jgi:hypothetical protein